MDEHEERQHIAKMPKATQKDPDMFKRLNERDYDEHRASLLSDGTIPPFHGELPVKSMDVSEIGFRERYQSALTSKGHARNGYNHGMHERIVRKSAIIS